MPYGSSGLSQEQSQLMKHMVYHEDREVVEFLSSLETRPSTVWLGPSFGISTGISAFSVSLGDGVSGLGLINRFDRANGSLSNPKFFALAKQQLLNVQTQTNAVMPKELQVNYTTAGDNLTTGFMVVPAEAGRLRFNITLSGNKVVETWKDIEASDVGQATEVPVNAYIMGTGVDVVASFSGVALRGNGVLPYFVSKVLPYKEVTINGHVERITGNSGELYIGCDYAADVTDGPVARSVPTVFKDRFRVYDYKKSFTATKKCVINFEAFGQGKFEMIHAGDDCEFYHVTGDGWYVIDRLSGAHSKVTARTTTRLTASRVMIVDALGERTASAVTTSELTVIDGNTTDSNIALADADRFVVNDSGTMRQVKASNVFDYIKSKLAGAISSVLTANLTANRVLVSDGSGKIAATSTVTPADLESLKPYKYIGGGSYSTKTLTVCSDLRGFKVWFDVTGSAISLKIKNSATGNLTGNGVISAGGEGSSDGGGWYEDISGSSDYTLESLTKGQVRDSSNNASKAGVVLFSVKNSASIRHIALHYAMHNTDEDEYAVYCKAE